MFPKPLTLELRRFHGSNSSGDSEREVCIEITGCCRCDDETSRGRSEGWMKHVPHGREESKTVRDWDPRTHGLGPKKP